MNLPKHIQPDCCSVGTVINLLLKGPLTLLPRLKAVRSCSPMCKS